MKDRLSYFTHDSDARHDPKMALLRAQFGSVGYAIYFIFVEIMSQDPLQRVKISHLDSLLKINGIEEKEGAKDIINFCTEELELFVVENSQYLTSHRLRRNMKHLQKVRKSHQKRGSLGGKSKPSTAQAQLKPSSTIKVKESKVKESKVYRADIFDILWQDYPKKLGKDNALKHYKASVETEKDIDDIKKALANYKKDIKGKDEQFIKYGSTWFNSWKEWIDYKPQEKIIAQ